MKVWRRTETGEAPRWQGATTENTGVFERGATPPAGMHRSSNAARLSPRAVNRGRPSAWARETLALRSALDEDLDLTLALDLPDELLELLVALPLQQVILDLPADLGKRRRARRAPFVNLDDVVAERRFDDGADRAGLKRKRG